LQVNAIPRVPATNLKTKTPMKTPRPSHRSGFTLIELLVVISIIAILAGLAMKAFPAALKRARLSESLSNAKQVLTGLKLFSTDNDGSYPYTTISADGGVTPGTALAAGDFSNKAFDNLLAYNVGKAIFINKASAYCKGAGLKLDTSVADSKVLGKGQVDWLYVSGMSDTTNGNWPLIATATKSAGDLTYTSDKNALGGVWEGEDAIIGYCDASAKPASKRDFNTTAPTATYVKSPIDGQNIFTGTADWLGTNPVILAPDPAK
jgi:prepilin-type N-terminal cleavage/methylation domain-containing protein